MWLGRRAGMYQAEGRLIATRHALANTQTLRHRAEAEFGEVIVVPVIVRLPVVEDENADLALRDVSAAVVHTLVSRSRTVWTGLGVHPHFEWTGTLIGYGRCHPEQRPIRHLRLVKVERPTVQIGAGLALEHDKVGQQRGQHAAVFQSLATEAGGGWCNRRTSPSMPRHKLLHGHSTIALSRACRPQRRDCSRCAHRRRTTGHSACFDRVPLSWSTNLPRRR